MSEQSTPKPHLLITGTGRAGTSFLVRYLDALGLETHFSRFGQHASWSEEANAGAENLPLSVLDEQLPYVVKSPWAGEFIDQLLADPGIRLDAVIIPMRDLMDAAASRVITEMRDFTEHQDFALKLDKPWAHHGAVPGGVVYSLHPLDQARVLAQGFHHLVERLVAADVPVVFLSFPRLAQDADYLHTKLAPILKTEISLADAIAAHAKVAEPAKIRVDRETADDALEKLERIALSREIERLRGKIDALETHAKGLEEHAAAIENSRMWRVLAPLRAALHWLKAGS